MRHAVVVAANLTREEKNKSNLAFFSYLWFDSSYLCTERTVLDGQYDIWGHLFSYLWFDSSYLCTERTVLDVKYDI